MKVEGGCGVAGQRQRIGLVNARVPLRIVDGVIKAEDLREQNDAVEVDATKVCCNNCRARRAITFAEEILGGIPATVLGKEAADETFESVAVAIDTARWPEVVGTISGDDTIFIATAGALEQSQLGERLFAIFGR